MKNIFLKLLRIAEDVCFPFTCICCDNYVEKEGLCKECWKKIKWISDPRCRICGKPMLEGNSICANCQKNKNYFDKAVSVFSYDDFSKLMILRFKNEDATYLAPIFAQWINRIIKDFSYELDFIIPVPTDFWRRLIRRYNQTELLAQELQKVSDICYEPRVLQKSGYSSPQKNLSRVKRLINLHKSFFINEKYKDVVRDKTVLLVDDVITTGATANECSKLLKQAGATKVYVATIAKVDLVFDTKIK